MSALACPTARRIGSNKLLTSRARASKSAMISGVGAKTRGVEVLILLFILLPINIRSQNMRLANLSTKCVCATNCAAHNAVDFNICAFVNAG